MNNFKATPGQWEEVGAFASATRDCILELRARVEVLEAQANPTKMVPPTVATDEELLKIWNSERACRPWVSRRAIYDLGVEHGQAGSREVADPAPAVGGLVERVKLAIDSALYDEDEHQWNEARAAILEVARWLDTRGQHGCSLWLREELEAGR